MVILVTKNILKSGYWISDFIISLIRLRFSEEISGQPLKTLISHLISPILKGTTKTKVPLKEELQSMFMPPSTSSTLTKQVRNSFSLISISLQVSLLKFIFVFL